MIARNWLAVGVALVAVTALTVPVLAQSYPWQQSHARVLEPGELQWTAEPFVYQPGQTVYYIDFEGGDDANPGTREQPWKHHPWDPNATGQAKQASGPATYVFKRGVIYRGVLRPGADRGTAEQPIRLTSDPSWGEGLATIYGSETVTGWQRGGHADMPQRDRVWSAEVDFLPRTLWRIGADGAVTRLNLARDPNWTESDPNDPMSEWPTWEQPEWWKDVNVIQVDGRERHLGIDTKNLTRPAKDYEGATVWTEWGIVMGSPYPARVEAFDPQKKGVAFRGPWTWERSERIITGNRYYLENKAWMLDEPGEFWVEKLGEGRARIYVRLPDDADPTAATLEAGRHYNILDAGQLHHVVLSGLAFRFTNIWWDYDSPAWAHPDLRAAVVRLQGGGDGIGIDHCRFEHVNMPVRINSAHAGQAIGTIRITDNLMSETDSGAIGIGASFGKDPAAHGRIDHVDVLRNRLYRIGWRNLSGEHGHAISLSYPTTTHVAGNFLHRIAGWGISVSGGKPSGAAGVDRPFSRHLVHHNRIEDVLLKSNDWGGIETWQGGPFYVYDNLVINPRGFKNWIHAQGNKNRVPAFGHAYYHDGAFKNYLFNNIAQGLNNEPGGKDANATALQNIFSFENTFFHNTFFRFHEVTRQQAPDAGRYRYLGNVIVDATGLTFRQADVKGVRDPNAEHFSQGDGFDLATVAFTDNVLYDIAEPVGVFEADGLAYQTFDQMQAALERRKVQASDLGVVAEQPPLRDPANGDFRPAPGSVALQHGVRVFVPWALAGVVGEWNFIRNNEDPARVIDEHWYMTPAYMGRDRYKDTPRYPLRAVNVSAEDFVAGDLEDWSDGTALRLDGQGQYLVLEHASLPAREPADGQAGPATGNQTVDLGFGTAELPRTVKPGEPMEVLVRLTNPPANQRPTVHVHWLKPEGWGGFNVWGGNPQPVAGQANTYRFRFTPEPKEGLDHYSVIVYLSPDGEYANKTAEGRADVRPEWGTEPARDEGPHRTVDIGEGNFLIEAYFLTADADGTLVSKHTGTRGEPGYQLAISAGQPVLKLADEGAVLEVVGQANVADGQWHHLVAEVDRQGQAVLYVDGQRVATETTGTMPTGSLANEGDFRVGDELAVTLDFLRVARGTLADARTTIGELYAWQFDGPQFRDFAGQDRRQQNAAGALTRP